MSSVVHHLHTFDYNAYHNFCFIFSLIHRNWFISLSFQC